MQEQKKITQAKLWNNIFKSNALGKQLYTEHKSTADIQQQEITQKIVNMRVKLILCQGSSKDGK